MDLAYEFNDEARVSACFSSNLDSMSYDASKQNKQPLQNQQSNNNKYFDSDEIFIAQPA